jgi:hypothetical protein
MERRSRMVPPTVSNFVKQQGFSGTPKESCAAHFGALNFQPRVVGPLAVLGILFQFAPIFLALSVVLWWSALLPRWNPFDATYNFLLGGRSGRPRLTPAPPPRRFSMGMSGSFMLGIGVSLLAGWTALALVLQGFLVVALVALLFGKFCVGSYIFHLLRGQASFANRTLPWARG